jgi:hypothetical protein
VSAPEGDIARVADAQRRLLAELRDLDIGVSPRDWSDEFVETWLPITRRQIEARLGDGAELPHLDDSRDELAWLYGRLRRDDLPDLPSWG